MLQHGHTARADKKITVLQTRQDRESAGNQFSVIYQITNMRWIEIRPSLLIKSST